MTAAFALLALDLLLLAAGYGVLHGIGLVRSVADGARQVGLALVAGWAAVGVLESWVLVVGGPIGCWVVALLSLALVAGGLAAARHVPGHRPTLATERGAWSWLAVAGAALVFVQFAALLRTAVHEGAPLQWDAWGLWVPKAKTIADFGGIDTGVGGFTSFASPAYPPLVPALQASVFAFQGSTRASALAIQEWVVAAAFLGAVWSLLATRVRPAILWPCLALLAALPFFTALVGSSLGDEPLMLLLSLGGACAAFWLLEREPRYAALAALFLAATALAKNEGMPPALVIGLTLVGVALARRPRHLVAPVIVLLAPLVAFAPWRIWIGAHGLAASSDYHLSDLLRPSVLGDRIHRLSSAADALPHHLFATDRWLVAVPLMLVAAALAAPRNPSLALLSVLSLAAVVGGLLVVYWIGFPPVGWYVATSADRVLASGVVMSVVFLPLLLSEASSRPPP